MTPEEAHAATEEAAKKQAATEAAYQTEAKEAADAQKEAATARQTAEADPTPANLEALAKADKKAADQTEEAAKAATERNDALTAANNARLAEVQALVAAANKTMVSARGNTNGIQWSTDQHFEQFTPVNFARIITSNLSFRITGVERKMILGASATIIGLVKLESVLACKNNLVVGFDIKFVAGESRSNFVGLKMDTIGGAKYDRTYGQKYEFHVGPKAYIGPADTTVQPKKDVTSPAEKTDAKDNTEINKKESATVGRRKIRASKVLADIKSLQEKVASLKEKAASEEQRIANFTLKTATLKINCSGNLAYEAKGTTTMDGGGAKVVLSGSAELSKGGSVKCDGSGTSVNGKVLIN